MASGLHSTATEIHRSQNAAGPRSAHEGNVDEENVAIMVWPSPGLDLSRRES